MYNWAATFIVIVAIDNGKIVVTCAVKLSADFCNRAREGQLDVIGSDSEKGFSKKELIQ